MADVPASTELARELAALAELVHTGSAAAREQFHNGAVWNPAGVLLEQALADIHLVYSLPKVGGTTVERALARHPDVRPEPLHVHFLTPPGVARVEAMVARHGDGPFGPTCRAQLALARSARVVLAVNRALRAAGAPVRKPFVVAGTRDPAALYLSLVFEGWWEYAPRFEDVTPERARAIVLDRRWRAPWEDWFDTELRAAFGLNVFAAPFDRARGWQVYESDAVRAVVYRQENIGAVPDALAALYGHPADSFALGAENAAESKEYAAHYAAVRAAVRFTDRELDELYAPRFVGHFYAPDEIAAFRARWRVGAPEPAHRPRAPEPACVPPTEPHLAVCRPCWKCKSDLVRLPHFEHRCSAQATILEQVQAAHAAREAQHAAHEAQLAAREALLAAHEARAARPLLARAMGRLRALLRLG